MYERLGGMPFFDRLTGAFYLRVGEDEVLRPLYPTDLDAPRRHLCLFLAQFFGGPRQYDSERGAPRLRARHLPFRIGQEERDHWVAHMRAAVEEVGPPPLERAQMLTYFESAADHLMNC
jgi:hemoglobin